MLLYLYRLPVQLRHNRRQWVCGDDRKMFIQQNLLLGDVIALFISQTAGRQTARLPVALSGFAAVYVQFVVLFMYIARYDNTDCTLASKLLYAQEN